METVPQILANPKAQRIGAGLAHGTASVWDAPPPLRLWHLASLDAPTVAVVWALAFAWVAGVRLPGWVPLLLALVAWAVYVGDRLLDARAGIHAQAAHRLRDRHVFHWRHRSILAPLAIAAAGCAAAIVFMRMPLAARERDSVLAAAAFVYFTSVHSGRAFGASVRRPPAGIPGGWLNKELLVGILFTAGCALPTWNRAAGAGLLLLSAPYFAALAWLNCSAIEAWEAVAPKECDSEPRRCHSERGRRGGRVEEPASHPNYAILHRAALLGTAGLCMALLFSAAQPRQGALFAAGAASALLLGLLDRLRNRLTPLALRAAADLALLTPLALFWR
jgi:hypothetical protein